jgi:hypothetical protein
VFGLSLLMLGAGLCVVECSLASPQPASASVARRTTVPRTDNNDNLRNLPWCIVPPCVESCLLYSLVPFLSRRRLSRA